MSGTPSSNGPARSWTWKSLLPTLTIVVAMFVAYKTFRYYGEDNDSESATIAESSDDEDSSDMVSQLKSNNKD